MKEKKVDARGKECPQPVLMAREAILDSGAEIIRVTVDDEIACENVQRLANSQGCETSLQRRGAEIDVVITRGTGDKDPAQEEEALSCQVAPGRPKVIVFVSSNLFGVGDEQLGRILMRSFIKTLKDVDPRPTAAIFANSGVMLTTEGSDLVDDLKDLENGGVEILSCGTCLDYYRLQQALGVGRASNMFEIASALVDADRVVRP